MIEKAKKLLGLGPEEIGHDKATTMPAHRLNRCEMATMTTKWADTIGASASIACAIHCLAAPFLVALAPVLVGETAEKWLSGFLILLSGTILARGWKTHRHVGPPLVFLVGAILLVCGRLSHTLSAELEHVMIVAVAVFFVGAHVYNFKCSKKCCGSHDE